MKRAPSETLVEPCDTGGREMPDLPKYSIEALPCGRLAHHHVFAQKVLANGVGEDMYWSSTDLGHRDQEMLMMMTGGIRQ
jgi:hypothetical protein